MTLTKETLRTSLLPKVRQSLQSFKSIIYKGKSWFIQTHWNSRANPQTIKSYGSVGLSESEVSKPNVCRKGPDAELLMILWEGFRMWLLGSSTFWYIADKEKLITNKTGTGNSPENTRESISSETEGKAWRWELGMTHLLSLLKKMKLGIFPWRNKGSRGQWNPWLCSRSSGVYPLPTENPTELQMVP